MVFYNLNGVSFANPYAAFLHGSIYDPHTFPKFDFYDNAFSAIDWTVEPVESFQTLCDRRAHQLRNKYEKLILAFSGGTDSITVYNTFVRNNIHIDEIYVAYAGNDDKMFMPLQAASWLMENHKDKTTKITVRSCHAESNINNFESTLASEDFLVTKNLSTHFKYNHPVFEKENFDRLYNNNSTYCIVTGMEKPTLVQRASGYYFTFLDRMFGIAMHREDLEFFFVSPDLPALHSKQCHMMLNYCLTTGMSLKELDNLENYYLKCAVQGRDAEPLPLQGSSLLEKQSNVIHSELLESIDFTKEISFSIIEKLSKNQTSSTLAAGLKRQSTALKNYIGGWHTLQTDQTLLSYMTRHQILSSARQPIQTYHSIMSMEHKLK